MTRFPIALFAGLIAGVVGAAVWAAVSYYTGYEAGFIAWGIGLIVGIAVAAGSGNEGGAGYAAAAVVITALSVMGGKYAAGHFMIQKYFADEGVSLEADDELAMSYLADELVYDSPLGGAGLTWPEGVDPNSASRASDYPAEVWQATEAAWSAMSEDERDSYRDHAQAGIDSVLTELEDEAFLASFGLIDIIFGALALFTAFKVAYTGGAMDEE